MLTLLSAFITLLPKPVSLAGVKTGFVPLQVMGRRRNVLYAIVAEDVLPRLASANLRKAPGIRKHETNSGNPLARDSHRQMSAVSRWVYGPGILTSCMRLSRGHQQ
jgi:hypothetical protein